MSDVFRDKGTSEEARFKLDEELQFKANARRNKLFGLWAAESMGKDSEAAEAYGKEIVLMAFDQAGDDNIVEKIMADLNAAGVGVEKQVLSDKLAELLRTAIKQISDDHPDALGKNHTPIGG